MATVLLAALLGGCSFLSKEADVTEVSSEAETESPGATQESETETAETEETQESHEAAEDEESGEEETEDHFVEKKIVVATDMHYFAEKLAGNRCDSFVGMARGGDGCDPGGCLRAVSAADRFPDPHAPGPLCDAACL